MLTVLLIIHANLLVAQTNLFVSAENGLIVRADAKKNACPIGKFVYGEELDIIEKIEKYSNVIDNGKSIKGQWYKVNGKSSNHRTISGYVFGGFVIPAMPEEIYEFISYNDDFDYLVLNAKKNDTIRQFIYDNSNDRSYLRGDIIKMVWKKDTVIIVGDENMKSEVKRIVSSKKLKNGRVSMYRKYYQKELKYIDLSVNYAKSILDKLYLIAEYYIASTTNEFINNVIKDRKQITYTVELRMRNDEQFTVIGIYDSFENKTLVLQWLYVSNETDKIYEYDLPNDALIEFE